MRVQAASSAGGSEVSGLAPPVVMSLLRLAGSGFVFLGEIDEGGDEDDLFVLA